MALNVAQLKLYGAATVVVLAIVGVRYVVAGGQLPFRDKQTAPVSLLSAEDRGMQAKLAPLVACLNRALTHFEGSAPAFRDTVQALSVPARPGLRPQPTYQGNLFKVTLWDKDGGESLACADGLERSAAMPPTVADLDATAKAIAVPLRAMVGPGAQWDTYIDQKTYQDDRFAAGRQLAATLSPLLTDVVAQTGLLRERVSVETAAIRLRQLAAIERTEGQSQRWHVEHLMIAARSLVSQVSQLFDGPATAAGVQAAIDPLQEAFDIGSKYAVAHPADTPALTAWRAVAPHASDELREAKELRRTLAAPPRETPAEAQKRLLTLMRNVGEQFDSLVEAYNRTRHDNT